LNEVPYLFLERLVQFLYNMGHDDVKSSDASVSVLQLHARMFALVDKYEILDLLSIAANRYSAKYRTSGNPQNSYRPLQAHTMEHRRRFIHYADTPTQQHEGTC
jgi:hypothetical protein